MVRVVLIVYGKSPEITVAENKSYRLQTSVMIKHLKLNCGRVPSELPAAHGVRCLLAILFLTTLT